MFNDSFKAGQECPAFYFITSANVCGLNSIMCFFLNDYEGNNVLFLSSIHKSKNPVIS